MIWSVLLRSTFPGLRATAPPPLLIRVSLSSYSYCQESQNEPLIRHALFFYIIR